MPRPEVVPTTDIPERTVATRQRSKAQRILDEQVREFADTIRDMDPEQSVRFHLTVEDDPGFAVSAPTTTKIKDRYRRMFRIAIDDADLRRVEPYAIEGSYRYHIEQMPDGSYHSKGFEVWAVKVEKPAR